MCYQAKSIEYTAHVTNPFEYAIRISLNERITLVKLEKEAIYFEHTRIVSCGPLVVVTGLGILEGELVEVYRILLSELN